MVASFLPSAEVVLRSLQLAVSLIQLGVTIAGLLAAAILLVWINHGLFPVLQLKIDLTELAQVVPGEIFVHIRLAVENNSKVHAKLRTGKSHIQILEYDPSQTRAFSTLNEWLPFNEEGRKKDKNQGLISKDRLPDKVMETTEYVEAGESIRTELLYRVSRPGVAVHCGLQVFTVPIKDELTDEKPESPKEAGANARNERMRGVRRWLGRIAHRLEALQHNPTDRFTSTAWIMVSGRPTGQSPTPGYNSRI